MKEGGVIQQRENFAAVNVLSCHQRLKGRRVKDPPKLPFQLRVILQLLPTQAHPDELRAGKSRRFPGRSRNLKQRQRVTIVIERVKLEVKTGREQAHQPVFQFFVALLGCLRREPRACHFMCIVLDSPHHVGVGLPLQRCRVAQSGQIFPDFVGARVVLLELQPRRFFRLLAQLIDEPSEILGVAPTHAASFWLARRSTRVAPSLLFWEVFNMFCT